MKKSKFKNETLVLFAILAFSLFLPMNVNAQNGGVDGFFRGGSMASSEEALAAMKTVMTVMCREASQMIPSTPRRLVTDC